MHVHEITKVKTAVVGCGMISNIYIRNLRDLFSVIDLVAVCDVYRPAAEEKAKIYGIGTIMTIDEVAASDEIELVVNLTGPTAHYSVIKTMLEAGKHVYTEKIFTTDLEKSRELAELAKQKGLYLAVAPDTVLGAGTQTARKLIDSGLVGSITSGFASVTRNQNLNSEFYRFLQKDGGALPYDVGIYYIATLIALLGSVKAIRAFSAPAFLHKQEHFFQPQQPDWTIPGNNVMVASLLFECGALINMHFNGNAVGDERSTIELYGSEGTLLLGDPNQFNGSVTLIRAESDPVAMPFTHGYDGTNTTSAPSEFDHYGNRGIGVAELAYALRTGRMHRLTQDYGLHCQEVLFGMDQAAATGNTYELESRCAIKPLKSGYYSTMERGKIRGDAERSLVD